MTKAMLGERVGGLGLVWVTILAAFFLAGHASAETILIGAGVRNGDFNADTNSADSRSFDATPFWFNIGSTNQTTEATRTNLPSDGTRQAVLASAGNRVHAQNSGYTIKSGDFFRVSYEWRDGFQWDDGQDRIEVRLFVTDTDGIGGIQTVVASLSSRLSVSNDHYQSEAAISSVVANSATGKTLFVGLYIIDGNSDTNDFAQLDNFELVVNPDPVSAILVGAGIRNGDFNADTNATDSRSFDVTPIWFNIGVGANQNTEATRTNLPVDETRHAVLASAGGVRVHAQNTLHTMMPGDVFRVSYDWRSGFQWDAGQDRIEIRLFVTDTDGIGGIQTVVASLLSRLTVATNNYQFEYDISMPASPAVAGKTLFVGLYINDGNGDANDFAQLDNFELEVNPLPEYAILVGPGVRNGDFNDDTNTASPRQFIATPFWQNIGVGTNQSADATATNLNFDGSRNAIIASAPTRVMAQNTNYKVHPGDVYRVSYQWRGAVGWDPGQDRIRVKLFVTDTDGILGNQTVIDTLLSHTIINTNLYQSDYGFSSVVDPSLVGKTLFVSIDIADGNSDTNDFARLDIFTLEANLQEDVILVGPGVWNGDFEADPSTATTRTYAQTLGWYNVGSTNQTLQATSTNDAYAGNRRGVLSAATNNIMAISPNYTIASGDVFRINYFWRDGNNWTADVNQVVATLFVTDDNTITGVRSEVATLSSGLSTIASAYEEVAVDTAAVTNPAVIGKRIFLSFDISGWNGEGQPAFAPLDNVKLIANPSEPLPEPPVIHTVDIVSITVLGAQITLKSTGTNTFEPGVQYMTNLTAEPQEWLTATLVTNLFANGTNTMVLGAPGAGTTYVMRIMDSRK